MNGIESIASRFYSDFILRDLLSFVTPGAIVLGSVLYLFLPLGFLLRIFNELNPLLYIPLLGLCYIIGIGLLMLGEEIDSTYECCFKKISIGWFSTFHAPTAIEQQKVVKSFHEKLTNHTRDQFSKIRERYVILMQACGTCCLAILISAVILLIKFQLIYPLHSRLFHWIIPISILIIGMFFIAILLGNGYCVHKKRLKDWDNLIIDC